MKQQIKYIKGKHLGTKSIDDLVVTGFFEISKEMYEKAHKCINKVLTMDVEYNGLVNQFNCTICTDTRGYLTWADDHGVLKLDIVIPDILLVGFILKGNIFLTLE